MKASFTDFNKVIDIIKETCGASEDSAVKATSLIWDYFDFGFVESTEELGDMIKAFSELF